MIPKVKPNPGETDDDFIDAYQFIESLSPSFLHIFPYSERANTPTAHMEGKLNPSIINERANRFNELCKQLHSDFYKKNIEKTANVLFESAQYGKMMHGFTENYVKVEVPYQKNLCGIVISVKLTEIADSGNMKAKILSKADY